MKFIGQPDGVERLGDFLENHLKDRQWTSFQAAIAFVKSGGVNHIQHNLQSFILRSEVKLSVGISLGGTSREGLAALHNVTRDRGELWICHNAIGATFHPKVYAFKNEHVAHVAIGSGNLTEGGLYTNYEASSVLHFDLKDSDDLEEFQQIDRFLAAMRDPTAGIARLLDNGFLETLIERGLLPPEVFTRVTEETGAASDGGSEDEALFPSVKVPPPPKRRETVAVPVTAKKPGFTTFFMTLQKTDVGVGQMTPGTSRRSPEIFIPLIARDGDASFWGWPAEFRSDPSNPKKMDRSHVRMLVGASVVDVNMMTWPAKRDFRLRSEAIRSGGMVGDILRIEKTDGAAGYSYIVTIIPKGTTQFGSAEAACTNPVRNSLKEWGYL